jgi:hypothetical protein
MLSINLPANCEGDGIRYLLSSNEAGYPITAIFDTVFSPAEV